jgi:hypothetical protein
MWHFDFVQLFSLPRFRQYRVLGPAHFLWCLGRGLCCGSLHPNHLRWRENGHPTREGVKQVRAKEDHSYPKIGV